MTSGPASYLLRWVDGTGFERADPPPRGAELYGLAAGDGRLWVAGTAERDGGGPEPYAAVTRW